MSRIRLTNRCTEEAFTVIEVLVAFTVMAIVMAALAPAFYGALRATAITSQRSQANGLAVAAIEQMRALPYGSVGYYTTPTGCTSSLTPVTLTSAGPLDSMPTTQTIGATTYSILRCVYWADSSIAADTHAYKKTVVTVSWMSAGAGQLSLTQSSALYPGGQAPYTVSGTTTTSTTIAQAQTGAPTCSVSQDQGDPTNFLDVSWTAPAIGGTPAYYVVYYTTTNPNGSAISGSSLQYTTSPAEYGTTLIVPVGQGTTYYFQVEAVTMNGIFSQPSNTCSGTPMTTTTTTTPGPTTTVPGTRYFAAASAQAVNFALGGGTVNLILSNPPTQATNSGTGSNSPVVYQPVVSIPPSDNFFSAAAASQIAEANTDGTSYACAGVLSNGGSLTGGSSSSPCTVSGSGTGGVSLNLMGLPGVGSALTSTIAGLQLNMNSATSWSSGSAGGTSYTGSASLTGATVTVTTLNGVGTVTASLGLASSLSTPTDLVAAIKAAINATPTISHFASTIGNALSSTVTLTGDYHSTVNGIYTTSAIHIALAGGGGTGDIALSSVGANSVLPAGSTNCTINSLAVTPSSGASGSGVALTSSGTLANQNSFSLAVNVSTGCSNVTVGYAPTGCTPGASGCPTFYASVTGTGGTLYGSAGTSSTVWKVGTQTFTVFVNGQQYNPLTQQNVTVCTEKGSSGKC